MALNMYRNPKLLYISVSEAPSMKPLETLDPARFDTPAILKMLAASSRRLAELKGLAGSIPN